MLTYEQAITIAIITGIVGLLGGSVGAISSYWLESKRAERQKISDEAMAYGRAAGFITGYNSTSLRGLPQHQTKVISHTTGVDSEIMRIARESEEHHGYNYNDVLTGIHEGIAQGYRARIENPFAGE